MPKKYITPVTINGNNDIITFEFDWNRVQKIDGDRMSLRQEDSTATSGFYVYYRHRKKGLYVRQYAAGTNSDIFVDADMTINVDTCTNFCI